MADPLFQEIDALAAQIERGVIAEGLARERLARLFQSIQRQQAELSRAHDAARTLLLRITREGVGAPPDGLALEAAIIVRLASGEEGGVEALAEAGNVCARGILLHLRNAHTEATQVLGGVEGEPLAEIFGARAALAAELERSGHSLALPLPADLPVSDPLFERVREAQDRLANVARRTPEDSVSRQLARLVLSELLFVGRRGAPATVTLAPVLEGEGPFGATAHYLMGRIRFSDGDRAQARASWLRSAEWTDHAHGEWARLATEAMTARRDPEMRDLLGHG